VDQDFQLDLLAAIDYTSKRLRSGFFAFVFAFVLCIPSASAGPGTASSDCGRLGRRAASD
jgi:hypothetical protein